MGSTAIQANPLERIIQISRRFKDSFACSPASSQPSTPLSLSTPPNLPIPLDIQQELEDDEVLQDLRTVLRNALTSLQSDYVSAYKQAQDKMAASPIHQAQALEGLRRVIELRFQTQGAPRLYQIHLKAKEDIAISIAAASTIPSTSTAQFNHVRSSYPCSYDRI